MELEEMKNTWELLNRKLDEDKSLRESLILEIIQMKANKSMNKLMNYEVLGVAALILLIPFMTFQLYHFKGKFIMWDIYVVYTIMICVLAACWYVFKIKELMKIDLSKQISDNIYHTNRFNIWIKREKLLAEMVFGPVFVVLGVFMLIEMKVGLEFWIFLVCMVMLATLGTYWIYKRIYGKNIESILTSLNEIKDLKEKD